MKPLSKNSIGVVIALLLVILLSESRLFKILTDTYLGRTFLIIMILCASYLNKILGVVCVFIIVIMFGIVKMNYEGFETTDTKMEESVKEIKDNNSDKLVVSEDKINVVTTETKNKEDEKQQKTDTTNVAIEGFDLQTTENNIKRGKQSNSIPVNQYNNQSIEVAPYENSSFSNFFGLL
jgi:uncharacterized membrane protein YfhO